MDVVFPAAEREVYDWITEEMHRNYRHGNGPEERCGAITPKVSLRRIESAGDVQIDAGLRQRKLNEWNSTLRPRAGRRDKL
jgi:hypothetical protein